MRVYAHLERNSLNNYRSEKETHFIISKRTLKSCDSLDNQTKVFYAVSSHYLKTLELILIKFCIGSACSSEPILLTTYNGRTSVCTECVVTRVSSVMRFYDS